MIRQVLAVCLALVALPCLAGNWPELKMTAEHPIDGMRGGNLSGLVECRGGLWGVSDRDDDRIYRFDQQNPTWRAQPLTFTPPAVPESGLPWGLKSRNWAASYIRGGELDFEGITCDQAGNLYLVSEAHAAVLQLPLEGEPDWLRIDSAMVRQARASGMLLNFNALFEGLAINPAGDRLWLAAERERRGLVAIERQQSVWTCGRGCVLLSEAGSKCNPRRCPMPGPCRATSLTWPGSRASCLPSNVTPTGCADVISTVARSSVAGRSLLMRWSSHGATRSRLAWPKHW